jgi:hypothetical protein
MRFISTLSAILLISGILMPALSTSTGEPGDIAVPSITGANMDVPAPRITAPNMGMPSPNPKPLSKHKIKSNNSNITLNKTLNASSKGIMNSQAEQKSDQMNISGKWTINFQDAPDKTMSLNLWSGSGNRIMGFGTMTELAAGSSVAASGSVNSNELNLAVKSASPSMPGTKENEYDLDLFMKNNTLSGTYVHNSGGQFLEKGNATAVRQ